MRRSLLVLTAPALLCSLALLGGSALAQGLTDMTDAERQAFRDEVRAYLLENPEVLTEAIDVLQKRQELAAAQAADAFMAENQDYLFNDPNSFVGGNPEGDITLVEFMDYRCGYCRKAHEEVADLIARDGNIRFVVKEFPILGDDSVTSSRFAIAVRMLHGDAAYAEVYDRLITLRGTPDADTLARLAADLGHDPAPILQRMGSDEVSAIIAANHDFARQMNITGTPTFFIGDQILRGYLPEDQMRAMVEAERAG
jgi:protein-disulfide isomerase